MVSAAVLTLLAAGVVLGGNAAALVPSGRRFSGLRLKSRLSRWPGMGREDSFSKSSKFFTEDPLKQAQALNAVVEPAKKTCHPQCTWNCGNACNTKCTPKCQAPVCVTECSKPVLSRCEQVCLDPQCVVVCPPQCTHGNCPGCHTVCNKPQCQLKCGQPLCKSKCALPVCAWDCGHDADSCKEPKCDLQCERPSCLSNANRSTEEGIAEDSKIEEDRGGNLVGVNEHEAMYAGYDVAWDGLAKLPDGMMQAMKAAPPEAVMAWPPPANVLPPAPVVARRSDLDPAPAPAAAAAPSPAAVVAPAAR